MCARKQPYRRAIMTHGSHPIMARMRPEKSTTARHLCCGTTSAGFLRSIAAVKCSQRIHGLIRYEKAKQKNLWILQPYDAWRTKIITPCSSITTLLVYVRTYCDYTAGLNNGGQTIALLVVTPHFESRLVLRIVQCSRRYRQRLSLGLLLSLLIVLRERDFWQVRWGSGRAVGIHVTATACP